MYSLGEETAINDQIIEKNLQNLIKKEDEIIKQYKTLKNLENYCPDNNKTKFMKLLESRKLFLEYKNLLINGCCLILQVFCYHKMDNF